MEHLNQRRVDFTKLPASPGMSVGWLASFDLIGFSSKILESPILSSAGTATAHDDYKPLRQLVKFAAGEVVKAVTVEIVDDQQWEPDESFFLRMSVPLTQRSVRLGRKTVMEIVIINDDGKYPPSARKLDQTLLARSSDHD